MKIRLYLDEDATSYGLTNGLRAQFIDVRTAREEGTEGYTDEQQILYARTLGRVIYTFNQRDFAVLHTRYLTESTPHMGIVVAPQQRYSVGEQIRRLMLLIEVISAEEIQDQIVYLSSWG